MSNYFNNIKKVNPQKPTNNKEDDSLLGPDYRYFKYILSPGEMGMSSKGSVTALGNDVTGLDRYMTTLVNGGGAQRGSNNPLGDRFFLETGAKCSDVKTGNQVVRSIYIDNVPNGDIPFVTEGLNTNLTDFEGIIPGAMQSAFNINPLMLFEALTEGTDPSCAEVTLPVRNPQNETGIQTEYLTIDDIKRVEPCLFDGGKNPMSGIQKINCGRLSGGGKLVEGFSNDSKINDCDKNINLIFKISICLLIALVMYKIIKKK